MSVMTKDRRFEEACNNAEKGVPVNMCEVLERIENKGKAEGKAEGMNNIRTLMQKLFSEGRIDDARKAACDMDYCEKLLKEYGLTE